MKNMATGKDIPGLDYELSREEAKELVLNDPEKAIFVLLQLSAQLAGLREAPSAPSSATPVYKKPTTRSGKSRKTKRGAKPGHPGIHRAVAPIIDRTETHSLKRCPCCDGTTLTRCQGQKATRTRIIEDIPADIKTEAVEHIIPRFYCDSCKKIVEPTVPDALSGSTFGHRLVVFVAWLRFGVGVTLSQVQEVLNAHLQFPISQGGIVKNAHRIAGILQPWYKQIGEDVKSSGVLNADETGWRVLGKTWWLWCFCAPKATYYMIHRSRGSPALSEFFTEAIKGILITDFWAAYNAVSCGGKQKCFPHLFRNIDATTEKDRSEGWLAFRKKLMRLLRDALRLDDAEKLPPESRVSRRALLDKRLSALLDEVDTSRSSAGNANVKRFVKRLRRHQQNLFTFLDYADVSSTNNFGEREIRPAVILRKNTFGNQSEQGAETQAILMSVFRTLRRRGLDPMAEIVRALQIYVQTGKLPPLPDGNAEIG